MKKRITADIVEIFSSLQGEGVCMGERHLFVRFRDCNLACSFCDERHTASRSYTVADVIKEIVRYEKHQGPHQYVVLTGGEPLCYPDFIQALGEALKKRKKKILLETNGTLTKELKRVKRACALVSMDIKLKSVWRTIPDCFAVHQAFLTALGNSPFYVKMAISESVCEKEFLSYLKVLKTCAHSVLVLQPLSYKGKSMSRVLLEKMMRLQRKALSYCSCVRVLPRLHTLWNIP